MVAAAGALALSLSIALGGCSFQLPTRQPVREIKERTRHHRLPAAALKGKATCRFASGRRSRHCAALSEVLSNSGKDAAVPWENPETGAHGTITPDRVGLQPGQARLPRFSGELCAQRQRGLDVREACRRAVTSGKCAPSSRGSARKRARPRRSISENVDINHSPSRIEIAARSAPNTCRRSVRR